MSFSKTSPTHWDKKDTPKKRLKVVRLGAGANKRKRAWLLKYLLENINDNKALIDPKGCLELTGTKALHAEPSITLIQLYDAVAILRNVNNKDFILNTPAEPTKQHSGNRAGFYHVPDKYRALAEKAIQKELGGVE